MAKKLPPHLPSIDNRKTSSNLRELLRARGFTVRDIQNYLGLSCPQSIYRWLDGKALPSIDNLYALQGLFGMPMERLLRGTFDSRFGLPSSEEARSLTPAVPFPAPDHRRASDLRSIFSAYLACLQLETLRQQN